MPLLQFHFAQAQQVNLSWSVDSGVGSASNSLALGSKGQLFKLSLVPTFENFISIVPKITEHNKELKEINRQSIYLSDKNAKANGILTVKDNLYFFTKNIRQKTKNIGFYCQPLDIHSLKNKGENINLFSFHAHKEYEQPTFNYQLSEDSTKLLITGSANNRSASGKYYIGIYNEAMKKLWDKMIDLPNKGKGMVVINQNITNDGRVALLVKHFDKGTHEEQITKDGKKLPAYSTKLLWFGKEETD